MSGRLASKMLGAGLLGALTVFGGVVTSAGAHPMSHSLSRVAVTATQVRVTLTIDLLEVAGVDRNGDARITFDELDASIERLYALVSGHYTVAASAPPTRVTLESYAIVENGHIGRFDLLHAFANEPDALTITSALHLMTAPEHRHLTSVVRDHDRQEALLDARQPSATFVVAGGSWLRTGWRFARLGVEHIVTGYDHLAFLVCLLLGASTGRSLVMVITSFTIAHSITLALATFDLVVLPSRLVESVIALSIAYVAAENFFGRRMMARYQVTFVFGLIHGFGFSNILRAMDLPRSNLAVSLFSFNAGVEAGQIAFVLVLFPLVTRLHTGQAAMIRAVLSLAVFGVAVFWLVERAWPA